jgi:hypothetical protein
MDQSGQSFVIFYLWKQNLRMKYIRADMKQTSWSDAYSNAQIARWAQGLEQGEFSDKAKSSHGRPLLTLGSA